MKYFLLFAATALLTNTSFARFIKPDLEEADRYEYSEFHGEQGRVIASKKEAKKEKVKEKEKERDVASDHPIQDAEGASGVKYWKY